MMFTKKIIYSIGINGKEDPRKIIAIIDHNELHKYLLDNVGNELSGLSQDCYYPKVKTIYKELLHRCNAKENELLEYSKRKYHNPGWKLLHDPYTTLLILICQDFLNNRDESAALTTINLMTLRYYTNKMFKYIRYCNPEYFRGALGQLSHNHIYNTEKTIGASLLHFSSSIFTIYKKALQTNNADEISKMIYALRTRVAQSSRSFAEKYYEIHKNGGAIGNEKEEYENTTKENKMKEIASKLAKDICIYNSVDEEAKKDASTITKFGREYARLYIEALDKPKYKESVETAYVLYLKSFNELTGPTKLDFLSTSKALMAVKVSNKPIFYKKLITDIHDNVVKDLNLVKTFNNWSIQTKAASRSFISYYLVLFLYNSMFGR